MNGMRGHRKKKQHRRELWGLLATPNPVTAEAARENLIESEPDLPVNLLWIWKAFWTLHSSRPGGFGPSAIPMTEIKAYCEMFFIDSFAERNLFTHCIQCMDAEWLKWAQAR